MILIVDNGGQYSHLIKRNCRDLDFEAIIINNKQNPSEIKNIIKNASKIILSGGPSSVTIQNQGLSGDLVKKILKGSMNVPLLGICFGHQLIAHMSNGKVEKGETGEYGICEVYIDKEDEVFKNIPKKINAWVSHFDTITELSEEFIGLAHSQNCKYEAIAHKEKAIYGVQFHPEVWHTEHGETILKNFLSL